MAGERTVKVNDFCRVSTKKGTGYIIRMNGYSGFTATINEDGRIVIGQSYKHNILIEDWQKLNQEISLGFQYMSKVIMLGRYPDAEKQSYIRGKAIKNFALYKDESGRYILWVGEAELEYGNRLKCPYVYAEFTDLVIESYNIVDNILYLNGSCSGRYVDSRTTKPTKLVELVKDFGRTINGVAFNGMILGRWRVRLNSK